MDLKQTLSKLTTEELIAIQKALDKHLNKKVKKSCGYQYTTVKAHITYICRFCETTHSESYNVEVLANSEPAKINTRVQTNWCSKCEEALERISKYEIIHQALEVIKELERKNIKRRD